MKIVLLSGGSGKRLWPLSNEARSKQFLKLLPTDSGERQSMVQRVYGQIKKHCNGAEVFVATSSSQVDSIRNQLPKDVSVITEPCRRDTFPAIALSVMYLYDKVGASIDETVIVLPVDPYAEGEYFKLLNDMDKTVQSDISDVVLMGITPTYPSGKYGYIMCEGGEEPKKVTSFVEKPSEKIAAEIIDKGAVWNGGVFAFKVGYLVNICKKLTGYATYNELVENYSGLSKISFDYAVLEKEKSISMLSYGGEWKDLGTWNTVTEQMLTESIGEVELHDSESTHIINELDIPLVAMGLKDVVIAASPDGILVSDKNKSSYIKPIVDKIDKRPMYEERRWGEYKIMEYSSLPDGEQCLVKKIHMLSGKQNSYQSHNNRDEIWTFINGSGILEVDGHSRPVRRGDVAYIMRGQKHTISAVTDLQFIEVQIGNEISDADVERFPYNR